MGMCTLKLSNVSLGTSNVDLDCDAESRKFANKHLPSSGNDSFVSSIMDLSKPPNVIFKSYPNFSRSKITTKVCKPTAIKSQSDQEYSDSKITTEASESKADICQSYLDYPESTITIEVSESSADICQSYLDDDCKIHSLSLSSSMVSFVGGEIWGYDGTNKKVTNRTAFGAVVLDAQIDHGANPNMKFLGDRTSLMVAVLASDYNLTKKLVERGADINYKNKLGETALGFAIELKDKKILNYLRLKGAVEVKK